MDKITTISIKTETRLRLQDLGRMGQTFDDVINELIEKSRDSRIE